MNAIYEYINHGVKNSYGVVATFTKTNTSTNYIVDIAYQQYQKSNYITQIHRKQFFINGVEPKKTLDVLALQCAKIVYPLQFISTPLGALKELYNFKEIQKRLHQELPSIKKAFQGEVTDHYFSQIEATINKPTLFEQRLKNDIFFTIFFQNLPVLYNKEKKIIDHAIRVPIKPYKKAVLFTGTQIFEKQDPLYCIVFLGEDRQGNTLQITHKVSTENLIPHEIQMQYNDGKEDAIEISIHQLKERQQTQATFVDGVIEKMGEIQPNKNWLNFLTKQE